MEPLHDRVWDKASHAIAFGLFGFVCIRAFAGGLGPIHWRPLVSAVLFALTFAGFDEIRQSWLPDRVGALSDWIADAVGVLSSAAGFAWFGRKALFGARTDIERLDS